VLPRLPKSNERCETAVSERARVAIDTSVVIAGLLSWHEHHLAALHVLEEALGDKSLVLPGPALIEAYSVMTRLPAPHRVRPPEAHALLEGTFEDSALVVTLTANELWRFVRTLSSNQTVGGRSYDAHILACADKANASVLLTFNERDFLALAHPEIEIRVPGR